MALGKCESVVANASIVFLARSAIFWSSRSCDSRRRFSAATEAIIPIEQFAPFFIETCPLEFCGAVCDFHIARVIEHLCGARESGDHQAVPGGDDLIVEMRARTFRANGKQFFAALRERFANFLFAFLKMLCRLCDRVSFN